MGYRQWDIRRGVQGMVNMVTWVKHRLEYRGMDFRVQTWGTEHILG